jgi:hypothetical protein
VRAANGLEITEGSAFQDEAQTARVISVRGSRKNANLLSAVGREKVAPVWSLWKGYWPRPTCNVRKWCERNDVPVRFIHSGGHVWPEDIARLIAAIEPGEAVPVHTDARA